MARYNLATNKSLIENVLELSKYARTSIDKIKGINVVHTISNPNSESHYHDISKLLLDIKHLGKTGFELYDILKKEYNIQIEFGETFCILAIISVGDTKDSINSLITALQDLSDRFYQETLQESVQNNLLPSEIKMTPRQAFFNETQYIDIEQSVGKISGDQIMIYPPGIPLLLPGEVVTQNIITEYKRLLQYGTKTVGSIKSNTIKIKVVKEELSWKKHTQKTGQKM